MGDNDYQIWRARVEGTNISPQTLLATDYMNHFNEIIMLLEMIPDMPDLLDDASNWSPKSYTEHFQDSHFSDRELAIQAYAHVPVRYRERFEITIQQLDHVVLTCLDQFREVLQTRDPERIRTRVTTLVELLHQLADVANGIIHGSETVMDQADIDAIMGVSPTPTDRSEALYIQDNKCKPTLVTS
ncbi:hypothetical protein JCM17960_06380 [Magnetospira thiophila]